MTTDAFYRELPAFSDFELLSTDSIFRAVPEDWFVIIADIEESGREIEAGRYREVNTVGAGTVVVLQALLRDEPLAFVFGGDGASFLLSPKMIDQARTALANYRAFCAKQFGVTLRVGVVPVKDILAAGQKLEAAKFSGAGGKCTAFIRGGGLVWADYTVKSSPRKFAVKQQPTGDVSLEGLSCRWKPLASQKGRILTVLVQPRLFDRTEVFESLLADFRGILGGNLESANPVCDKSLRYRGFWSTLASEWKLCERIFSKKFLGRVFEILLCQAAFRFRLPVPFAAELYMTRIPAHSDFRKYDDTLRLVLDCSHAEIKKIEDLLRTGYERGKFFYGTHESSHALMTCLLENLGDGGHIHLIDGSNGGYTMAARSLASQRLGKAPPIAA